MSKPLRKPASERSEDKGPPADPEAREGGDPEQEGGPILDEPTSQGLKITIKGIPQHVDAPTPGLVGTAPADQPGTPDDPPAATTRSGYEGYEQGEATEREPTDIPMPPAWKGTEDQWIALGPKGQKQFVADTEEAHRASQLYVPLHER